MKVKITSILMVMFVSSLTFFSFTITKTEAQFGDCDSSYPDVCIPSPPPDLDCTDISDKKFTVLPPDPHGFDRDGDGIGCES
ncbi:MAG TPA: excalibur calcium-binding domain-containing protein [Nitrososphaeraceae archaeon]|nr:excalibur calcium-binding domain-containing protein [Nitrososphaeraceae archaeon]